MQQNTCGARKGHGRRSISPPRWWTRAGALTLREFFIPLHYANLAVLLHLLAEIGDKDSEEFLLLILQERFAQLVLLSCKIRLGWRLFFEQSTTASAPCG